MNSAAEARIVSTAAQYPSARVVDIRTGQPWRPVSHVRPHPRPLPPWRFLWDMAVIFSLGALGAWLFVKMQGG